MALTRGSGRPGQVGIRGGNSVWNDFKHVTQFDRWPNISATVLFDHHHVVDTLSRPEACTVGVELDHNPVVVSYLCSFGKKKRHKPFKKRAEYRPLIDELDGYIFTDFPAGWTNTVDVYREPWMGPKSVGVKGDKGQVASLLRSPTILFDDKEENVDLLRARSTVDCTLDGFIVRRGRKALDPVVHGYENLTLNNCNDWVTAVEAFGHHPEPAHILRARDPPIDLSQRDLCEDNTYPLKFRRTIGLPDSVMPDAVVHDMRRVVNRRVHEDRGASSSGQGGAAIARGCRSRPYVGPRLLCP